MFPACKSAYPGSIPGVASTFRKICYRFATQLFRLNTKLRGTFSGPLVVLACSEPLARFEMRK